MRMEVIGNATLYCGDSREILEGLQVGAVVTDPPYGIGLRNGDVDGHRSDHWDSITGDQDGQVTADVLAWALADPTRTVTTFSSPWRPWPGRWRNLIVWDKGGQVGGGGDVKTCLKRTWELIQIRNPRPFFGSRAESVWHFPMMPTDTRQHICAKPVGLMSRLLSTFVDRDEVIFDPFMGSGSTGVACANLGRKFVGVEIEPPFFEVACERIEAEQSKGRLFA